MLALERVADDKGKMPTLIPVDMVRKTIGFFGSTAGEGGWRVCIVDWADELNAAGANALLKILEEPPAKALLLVVSHAPGRLLPTIRSRCRRLALRPLAAEDVARAAGEALGPRRRRGRHQGRRARLRRQRRRARSISSAARRCRCASASDTMLAALPAVDPRDLHALGDALGRDETSFTAFVDAVRDWLSARVTVAGAEPGRLVRIAEVWEKLNARRAMSRSTISSESRWFSTCSAGLRQPRAVDTKQSCRRSPATTSRPRSPTRMARRISGTATRPLRPMRSRASSGWMATMCFS